MKSGPPSANAALLPHPRLQTSYPPSAHLIFPSPALPPPSLAPGYTSASPASSPPPDSLRVLQWNAGGLRARSTKLLHFLSSHSVDLICIQASNLNSSSSFRIPGFSVLRSDRTHSRSCILSSDATHASGGVIIFVRQGLSFSELSTTSLSSLDPYSDYVGVNISLNKSSSVSFLNVYAPPYLLLPNGWQNRFLLSLHSSLLQKSLLSGRLQLPSPALGLKSYFRPPRGGSIRLGHLLRPPPLNDPDTPTLLHRSSPDISFAPSTLAPGRCFRTWVLIIYQFFFPSLSLRCFAPTSVPLPSIFRKLAGMALPPTLTLTVLLQRNTRLFLFPLQLLSLPLWH